MTGPAPQAAQSRRPPLFFQHGLAAQPNAVRHALIALRRELTRSFLTDRQADRIEIVLGEALNNIVEHAFDPPRPDPWIEVLIRLTEGAAICTLRDNGREMPADPASPRHRTDPRTLPEGGFGWGLIHQLSLKVEYERCCGTNTLILTVPLRLKARAVV